MSLFPEGVEVGLGLGCHAKELLDAGAGKFGARGAGGDGSGQGAFADFAELVAVVGLDARGMAAGAVDVLGFDGGVVQPRPFLGDFGAKGVVVFLRCDESVALLAIQAAITDHVVSFAFDKVRQPLYRNGGGGTMSNLGLMERQYSPPTHTTPKN
jgi:hypothetical protein